MRNNEVVSTESISPRKERLYYPEEAILLEQYLEQLAKTPGPFITYQELFSLVYDANAEAIKAKLVEQMSKASPDVFVTGSSLGASDAQTLLYELAGVVPPTQDQLQNSHYIARMILKALYGLPEDELSMEEITVQLGLKRTSFLVRSVVTDLISKGLLEYTKSLNIQISLRGVKAVDDHNLDI